MGKDRRARWGKRRPVPPGDAETVAETAAAQAENCAAENRPSDMDADKPSAKGAEEQPVHRAAQFANLPVVTRPPMCYNGTIMCGGLENL